MFCWVRQCNVPNPPPQCFDSSRANILCQHGDDECKQDTIEGCAFALAKEPSAAVDFLYCFEGQHSSSLSSAKGCAKKSGLDFNAIESCANGPMGANIDVQNAKATVKLGSSKLGTPWVYVDGKHLDDTDKLLSTVCASIKQKGGGSPAGCAGA